MICSTSTNSIGIRWRFGSNDDEVDRVVKILNELTPEQQEAVRIYGRSQHEDGYDSADQSNSN